MKNSFKLVGFIILLIFVLSCEEKPVPPVISTAVVTQISPTTAVSGGSIADEGGAAIISKGVCWNTTDNPEITNNKTTEESGTGSFASNISNLTPNTTYFVRAYATNSAGTGYGSSVSFKTTGDKPVSTIANASEVLTTSATLNGTVNPNSLSTTVTFEYGLTTSYGGSLVASQSPLNGDSNGIVSVALSGLNPGKMYHFRIKAENSLGIIYSNDLSFYTLGNVPVAVTLSGSNLKVSTVTMNGSVNPGYLATNVIFEWGTTINYGNTITSTLGIITGHTPVDVNAELSGLNPMTTYHYRIKTTNELGTTIGEDKTFKTYEVLDADGNGYYSVAIGTQIWLSENLKTTHFQNGEVIPNVSGAYEWSALTSSACCYYKNEISNSLVYGNLYNFFAAEDSRNVCPSAWHVPSRDEWTTLFTYLGGETLADTKLRETGITHWLFDTGASNSTGFTILPAGNRESNGDFFNLRYSAYFWSSLAHSENGVLSAWNTGMDWNAPLIRINPYPRTYGASIRCIKN